MCAFLYLENKRSDTLVSFLNDNNELIVKLPFFVIPYEPIIMLFPFSSSPPSCHYQPLVPFYYRSYCHAEFISTSYRVMVGYYIIQRP